MGPCFCLYLKHDTKTHMHGHKYVGDVIHIPSDVFTVFHRLTVGGGDVPRKVVMCQQKEVKKKTAS